VKKAEGSEHSQDSFGASSLEIFTHLLLFVSVHARDLFLEELSREHGILLKRIFASYNKRKDIERQKVEEEAEKETEETEKRLQKTRKKAREAEKRAWEKQAWYRGWSLRRIAEKTKYEEDSVRDKTERVQKLKERTLEAEKENRRSREEYRESGGRVPVLILGLRRRRHQSYLFAITIGSSQSQVSAGPARKYKHCQQLHEESREAQGRPGARTCKH
jgi:hypothetical protein